MACPAYTNLELENMPQEELEELVWQRLDEPEDEPWHAGWFASSRARQLTPTAIVKSSSTDFENGAFMIQHVQKHTTIPIPKILRHWSYRPKAHASYTVMEYIPGDTVEKAWPKMNPDEQLWVSSTLRDYIRQLRAVPPPSNWSGAPGPFDQSGLPMRCPGSWIFGEDGTEAFDTYDAMTRWFDDRRTRLMLHKHECGTEVPEVDMFDNTQPLVMSHGDLNMTNIILEKDPLSGKYVKVWLIDWDGAGFYPQSFEYSFMLNMRGLPQIWMDIIPFVAGHYYQQYQFFLFLNHGLFQLFRYADVHEINLSSVKDEKLKARMVGWR